MRYADDTILIAENSIILQEMLSQVSNISGKYGSKLNSKKTKVMVVKKSAKFGELQGLNVKIGNEEFEEVGHFTYL